ncbi:hypothetical protein PybrP1_004366 [[Pythium] brassicae (nom. inval.)]|nr:hypothetical protein PybrP1_004366 [[Pythium] brassicae (nom. inval.)]
MKIVAPILALTLAVASFSSAPVGAVVAADTCAVPAKTLVFDKCGKSCQSGSPCMSNVSCKIECFDASYITRKSTQKREFWFLVQFGKWKSEQEKANEKWLPKSEVDKYSMSGKKSNDDLTAIGAIKVPADANGVYVQHHIALGVVSMGRRCGRAHTPAASSLCVCVPSCVDSVIRGGASDVETIKSRVANVDFEPDFLAESKHVTIVKLENLNLAKSADKLLANFPPKVEVVSFSNGLLTEVPTNIAKFKTLQELYVCACVCHSLLVDNCVDEQHANHWRRLQGPEPQLHHIRPVGHQDGQPDEAVRGRLSYCATCEDTPPPDAATSLVFIEHPDSVTLEQRPDKEQLHVAADGAFDRDRVVRPGPWRG